MKYTILLIILAFLSIVKCSTDKTVTIEDGIITVSDACMGQENPFSYTFYISISTEGFEEDYNFKMLLAQPSYAFAECTIFAPQLGPIRSTSESEQMKCTISMIMFPLTGPVYLDASYDAAGEDFVLLGWNEVIGKNYIVKNDENDCHPPIGYLFTPGSYIDQCTSEKGVHDLSVMGTLTIAPGYEFTRALSITPYLLVDSTKYRGALCTLNYIPENSGEDYELRCQFEDGLSAQFFPTLPYDSEDNSLFVWISQSNPMELKNCFSSFIKLSSLILLSLLLF